MATTLETIRDLHVPDDHMMMKIHINGRTTEVSGFAWNLILDFAEVGCLTTLLDTKRKELGR